MEILLQQIRTVRLKITDRPRNPIEGHVMATRKLEFSLRLRHATASLSAISRQLGLSAHAGWDKGEQNLTLQGAARQGTRESSYRSFALPIASCTELDEGVAECLKKLLPFDSVLQSFVASGGMASLAVAWYSDT